MIIYLILTILPILLNLKATASLLVFLVMNSLINFILVYTKRHIRSLGAMIGNEEAIDDFVHRGIDYDKDFEEHLETLDLNIYIPKLLIHINNISSAICLIAIIYGIINLFSQ
mgnify:CR=1 FL=1